MLVPAEIVSMNFEYQEVKIFNSDHSLKKKRQVTRATMWRLVKMWANTPEEWRRLEWIWGECVATFRHRRKYDLLPVMTWKQYHQYREKGEINAKEE